MSCVKFLAEKPGEPASNNTLQVTFDPLPTFAVAKAVIASNAPERGRSAASQHFLRLEG